MSTRILTGLKPTGAGDLHLGNYVGALRPLREFAAKADHEVLVFVADSHALTTVQDGTTLRENTQKVAAALLAVTGDLPNVTVYRQSDISALFELSFILACHTAKGLMNRAHAYKALVDHNRSLDRNDLDLNINMGVYTYPILMAADILIFQPDLVPVGKDQTQHLEITRDIAQRLNHLHQTNLKLPEAFLPPRQTPLPGNDGRKMSKSYGNEIAVFSTEKQLKKAIARIKTDSAAADAPKDPNQSILFELFTHFSDQSEQDELRNRFLAGAGYGDIKQHIFDAINTEISPYRDRYNTLIATPSDIEDQLQAPLPHLRKLANTHLNAIKEKCGF